MRANRLVWLLLLALGNTVLTGCPSIAPYNQKSYELTTSTKAEALALLDKSNTPFEDHSKDVESLKLSVEKAYEYANSIPKNDVIVGMWEVIKGYTYDQKTKKWVQIDNENLYSTLARWKRQGTLSESFIPEKKTQIANSFDQIIELEGGKNK